MTTDLRDRITVRMFIGCLITSDLKLLLTKSHAWKEAQIVRSGKPGEFEEILYQNKTYFGVFAPESGITKSEISQAELELINKIKLYCPEYEIDKIKTFVFPQVFIS